MRFKKKNLFIIFSILIFWIMFGLEVKGFSDREDVDVTTPAKKEEINVGSGQSIESIESRIQEYVAWLPDSNWFGIYASMCENYVGPYTHSTIDGNTEIFEDISEFGGFLQYTMVVDREGGLANNLFAESAFETEYRKYYKYVELKKDIRGRINDTSKLNSRAVQYGQFDNDGNAIGDDSQSVGLWLYFQTNSTLDQYRRDGKDLDGGNGATAIYGTN